MTESLPSQDVCNAIGQLVQFSEGQLAQLKHDGNLVRVLLHCLAEVVIDVQILLLDPFNVTKYLLQSCDQPYGQRMCYLKLDTRAYRLL